MAAMASPQEAAVGAESPKHDSSAAVQQCSSIISGPGPHVPPFHWQRLEFFIPYNKTP